ncbi:hypothetical protein [Sphingobacterium sp.]|uniref:hypothetical protein n=1 Tax=Sphingobacterium sp. TaxID=341027 RepID=UPI002898C662|nr:hypothetical protein [Sphingobacterium sp.]
MEKRNLQSLLKAVVEDQKKNVLPLDENAAYLIKGGSAADGCSKIRNCSLSVGG